MMDRFTADLKEIWVNLGLKLNPVSSGKLHPISSSNLRVDIKKTAETKTPKKHNKSHL